MARKLLKDTCPLAAEILEGAHDADLGNIIAAAQARKKARFRRGTRVLITGTGDPKTEGKEGVIQKVNPKTISVGVGEVTYADWDTTKRFPEYEGGEWNMTENYLEVV